MDVVGSGEGAAMKAVGVNDGASVYQTVGAPVVVVGEKDGINVYVVGTTDGIPLVVGCTDGAFVIVGCGVGYSLLTHTRKSCIVNG